MKHPLITRRNATFLSVLALSVCGTTVPVADAMTHIWLRPPSGLAAIAGTEHVHLMWVDNSSLETGYQAQRQKYQNGAWSALTVLLAPANAQELDDDVDAGVSRSRVRATSPNGNSWYTSWRVANVSASSGGGGTITPPSAPDGIVAADSG